MKIILASSFNTSEKDEQGNRYAVPMPVDFTSVMKKNIPAQGRVVYVANNPNDYEIMDDRGRIIFESLRLSGFGFRDEIILDNRNRDRAREIITGADLIMLAGGKLECQLEFFHEIGLRELMAGHDGLFMGGSAGAMNLCKTVLNFPETTDEAAANMPLFLSGLGFFDEIIIPHFDGVGYPLDDDGFDPMKRILTASQGRRFIAFNDDSFILVRDGNVHYHGEFYVITDTKILSHDIS
ncbi:MAG: Type 1 glutamine amidotransferase-like domain-containing protein [Firmicutes bacterium]|nr:Type 1 glutamine amidotransferase-like domain-containing protein [Bacillota bacterium]